MRCSNCGIENPFSAKFCERCGARLARVCPRCGHELGASAHYCSECGAPVGVAVQLASVAPIDYTPPRLAERILAEQATLEARGGTVGERKTITTLFADMAGSTALIHDLDPEEADRLIAPVVGLMMEAVHHYEGYVAKCLGDGILGLFGAPIAHEDHPQRALYAALRMQDAMCRHSDRIRLDQGVSLHMRVGVHTGEVVVRSIRKDDLRADYDPVGHTIHIASRMETMAAPSSILVSESTYKLAQGYFDFKPLGAAQVKGVPTPIEVYQVLGLGALRTRLQVAARRGLARFVGRESELQSLHRALEQATASHGQIVGVVGEAGVGKSRLFLEFKERSQRGAVVLETFSVSHGKAFAYLPLVELLKHYFKITVQDDERQCCEKITGKVLTLERGLEDQLPYLLALLGISEPSLALADMDANIRRIRTFEAITRLLVRESLNQPVKLLFEDLQWLDSETEAFLAFFVDRMANARILLLVNYRPEYQPEWSHKSYYTQLRLDPLGESEAQALLSALLGDDPELAPLKQLILTTTEGNPFFIEEVVQTLAEEKTLLGEPGHYRIEITPTALRIPTTVQSVLAARMDRLPPAEKALLQTLAVIGKASAWNLIRAVCTPQVAQSEDDLRRLLSHLETAEFIYELPTFPEVEYTFKHALTQEVAKQSMLSHQRTALHERSAQAIEAMYPTRLRDYCNDLAHHYSESGNAAKALEYLQMAGEQALQRSASLEAIRYFEAALAALERLPDAPEYTRHELALRLSLGPPLMATRGLAAPEVEATYTRALALCEKVRDTSQRFSAHVGLRACYQLRAQYDKAIALAEQLLSEAESLHEPGLLVEAHRALGSTLFRLGDLSTARIHVEKALSIGVDRQQVQAFHFGQDAVVHCLGVLAWVLSYQGYPDQAVKRTEEAIALARTLSHTPSLAQSLILAAEVQQSLGAARSTQEYAEAAIALSIEQGFPFFLACGTILRGWALAEQGDAEQGGAQLTQGLSAYRASGAQLEQPHFLALLASAYGYARQAQAGLHVLAEALTIMEKTGERCHEAELHRLNGELLLRLSSHQLDEVGGKEEADACFRRAMAVAHDQGARMTELRATLSLVRLQQQGGNGVESRQRLAAIHSAFTEGFDTVELRAAKALLDDLR
jgi:class 3 adenylate cyclase/tetratricopeptide (TPR) repeat protein